MADTGAGSLSGIVEHCGAPMTYRGSTHGFSGDAALTEQRWACGACKATATLTLSEPC